MLYGACFEVDGFRGLQMMRGGIVKRGIILNDAVNLIDGIKSDHLLVVRAWVWLKKLRAGIVEQFHFRSRGRLRWVA